MIEKIRKYNPWSGSFFIEGYQRKAYLDKLKEYMGNSLVKVLLGQRRSGKSYILKFFIEQLLKTGVKPENILYINMDIAAFSFIKNGEILLELIDEFHKNISAKGKTFIFLDEVQEIDGWEKVVNSLSQDHVKNYEVFITGSNAKLLSTELATYLAGRYVTLNIFPFSYSEYIDVKKAKKSRDSFINYMREGGIPQTLFMDSEELKRNYVTALKDSIVLRDIIERFNVRQPNLLEKIIYFSMDSLGAMVSAKSISDYLKSNGFSASRETVIDYLNYLAYAFFLYEIERYDLKGKKILTGEKKYYLNDPAFKLYLTSGYDPVPGKYLENSVYLHLLRKGNKVFVGRQGEDEIDFVAEKDGERIYIQVAYMLQDEKVQKREFGNLEKIGDNYPKLVVSLDDFSFGNRNGIQHICAWDFVE